jgi:Mg-chelatase subunit ChlD
LPNKQNLYCDGRSSWEVIAVSPDFANGLNPPNNTIANTDPAFHLVGGSEASEVSYVLVMDVSASMQEMDRFRPMKDAAKRWLRYDVREGVRVGLVRFADENLVVAVRDLTVMTNESREEFIQEVEGLRAGGRTCIGCGLKVAKVLSQELYHFEFFDFCVSA